MSPALRSQRRAPPQGGRQTHSASAATTDDASSIDIANTNAVSKIDTMETSSSFVDVADKVKPCYLLKLPAELRIAIFSLALVYHDSIILARRRASGEGANGLLIRPCNLNRTVCHLNLAPGLLATCHQIRDEATPVFYGENRFIFDDENKQPWVQPCLLFFLAMVKESTSHLREIELKGQTTKKMCRANFVALRKFGVQLASISLDHQYLSRFTPEQMADALGPLVRALDKQYKADKQRKTTSIVDKLEFLDSPYTSPINGEKQKKRVQEYNVKVKDLLRKALLK